MLRRLNSALGSQLSHDELVRLCRATFAYREMARFDEAGRSGREANRSVDLDSEGISMPTTSTLLIAPGGYFTSALAEWIAGQLPSGLVASLWILPPPLVYGEGFAKGWRQAMEREGVHREHAMVFRIVRTGLFRCRIGCAGPVSLHDEAEALSRVGQQLDDCLRDNPAQHDWFVEARHEQVPLNPPKRT